VKEPVDTRPADLVRLQAILRAVLDDPAMVISESSPVPATADPARHLELLAAIERAFGVRFTTREISRAASASGTVGELLDLLARRLAAAAETLRSSLAGAVSDGQRLRVIEAWVREQASAVLGVRPSDIVPTKVFQDLGMTSLTAVERCARLEAGLGFHVAPMVVYNYASLTRLVPYLAGRLGSAGDSNG
jgi:acyl carrier protein